MLKLAPLAVLTLKRAPRVFVLQTTHLAWTMEVRNIDSSEVCVVIGPVLGDTLRIILGCY
jgi:hypothetical protein